MNIACYPSHETAKIRISLCRLFDLLLFKLKRAEIYSGKPPANPLKINLSK